MNECLGTTPTFLVIGHISEDATSEGIRPGGSLVYSALTARNLGERTAAITSARPDSEVLAALDGITIHCIPAPVTTSFENIYVNGQRQQILHALAKPIRENDIPVGWRNVPIVHLAPICGEIASCLIDLFPTSFVGLTPQGWMRQPDAGGRIRRARWRGASRALSRADAIVLSYDDIEDERTITTYARRAKVLVVTHGAAGADLYHKGAVHHFPSFPARAIDPTGAGDAFAAAFFIQLMRSGNPLLAMRFASCVASFVVEGVGITGIPTLEQVQERMAQWDKVRARTEVDKGGQRLAQHN